MIQTHRLTVLRGRAAQRLAAGLALLACAAPASAQRAGDDMLQLGYVHSVPTGKGSPLQTDLRPSAVYPLLGIPTTFTSDGTTARVDDFDTAALTYTHFFTNHFAAKLDVGVPARVHLRGEGVVTVPGTIPPPAVVDPIDLGAPQNNPIASAREWNPAVLALYYFGPSSWLIHPNIGIGATYTWYSAVGLDETFQNQVNSQLGPVLASANGKPPITHMDANVSRSWSPVFNAGLSYDITRHVGLTSSFSFVLQKTTARINIYSSDGTQLASSATRLTVNPFVFALFLNYRF